MEKRVIVGWVAIVAIVVAIFVANEIWKTTLSPIDRKCAGLFEVNAACAAAASATPETRARLNAILKGNTQ